MVHNEQRTKHLITGAVGFLETSRAILEREGMFHWPAFFVNVSYAAELSLKAFLSSRDFSRQQLLALNHDLKAAFDSAIEHGYLPPIAQIEQLLSQINGKHASFRYLEGEALEIAEPKDTIAILEILIRSVGEQIPVSELRDR